jgi:ribosomal protein S3
VGELIPAGERVAIGLRFRAASTAQLERAVQATARGLRLECSPT